jgi:acetylornithine deacetylase/succinyl-diaminopimelate desuccinylase-like protein
VKLEWGPGYAAYRADLDSPFARGVRRALERATGQTAVLSSGGGSLPLAVFAEVLGAPIIMLPIANHDDNQHAADENLRLQNLRDGIAIYAEVLATLGREW